MTADSHPAVISGVEAQVRGEAYEPMTGRWSRVVAPHFISWLGAATGGRWLDVGSGTGALIQTILDRAAPSEVVGVDRSSAFIAYARRQITDARVRYEVGDARSLPVASRQYDAVVAGLLLNHLAPLEQGQAVREMIRAARTGGVVGAYVWDYVSGFQPRARFWEAATALDAAASAYDERARYPLCQPEPLERLFQRSGLNAIESTVIDISAHFTDFEDYWTPFLAGYGVASAYLTQLPAEQQKALRSRLHRMLPAAADGSITLGVRAFAVKGLV